MSHVSAGCSGFRNRGRRLHCIIAANTEAHVNMLLCATVMKVP